MQHTPFLIGIAGGSGSGKTSFLHALMEFFTPAQVALVSQDNYYKPKAQQLRDENGWVNYDLPTSIDREHFYADILALQSGKTISKLEYNFNNPEWEPQTVEVKPAPVLIVEGLFVFHFEEIMKHLNYKVYLNVEEEIRLKRRIKRDAEERSYPESEVKYQWVNHVMPAEEKYLLPYLDRCDLLVDNTHSFAAGLNRLVDLINTQLKTIH